MTANSPGNTRPVLRYALAALLYLASGTNGAGASELPADNAVAPAWQLNALAAELATAPGEVRADLAGVALDELAAAYAQEALQARQDMQEQGGDPDLQRWADAVDGLAAHIAALAGSVTSLTRVSIGVSPEHSLYLVVDGEPVVVNGPRANRQAALEQRIIERFCGLHACTQLFTGLAAMEPLPARASGPAPVAPHWRFTEGAGPVCSSGDGLDFAFRDSDNLLRKRGSCKRAIGELHALAEAIAQHASSGARVEWGALAVRGAPAADRQEVALDNSGATLQLHLPLLAATPRLLSEARPWLAARIAGIQHRVVIENAEQLLPLDPAP